MKRLVVSIVIALQLLATGTAYADRDRRAYVSHTLTAVRALGEAGRTKLDRDIYAAARARCRADDATPTVACMLEVVRSVCGSDATCLAAGDVIATNLRGTNELLDEAARIRILRKTRDYRADLTAELMRRYAVLAAELVLADHRDDAAAIDQLCTERDREIHACEPGATACIPSVPWSRCVAMLVWFVGNTAQPGGSR
jgi:hypothetical protein